MEQRIKKTITIPISVVDDMEKKSISPSKWFSENYKKTEMNIDCVVTKIEETTEELEKLKNLAGVYIKQEEEKKEQEKEELEDVSENKKEFFRETNKRLKRGLDLAPQYRLFCFEFGDIELAKFKYYLDYFKKEEEKNKNLEV